MSVRQRMEIPPPFAELVCIEPCRIRPNAIWATYELSSGNRAAAAWASVIVRASWPFSRRSRAELSAGPWASGMKIEIPAAGTRHFAYARIPTSSVVQDGRARQGWCSPRYGARAGLASCSGWTSRPMIPRDRRADAARSPRRWTTASRLTLHTGLEARQHPDPNPMAPHHRRLRPRARTSGTGP